MDREDSWRSQLREALAKAIVDEHEVTIGDLVGQFADLIPLHSASRKWAANQRGRDAIDYPPAHRMRTYTLTQYLHWLKCGFDPPGRKTWSTQVIVRWRFCPVCARVFVAEPHIRTCGAQCGKRLRGVTASK
jgi:hypothetical protein